MTTMMDVRLDRAAEALETTINVLKNALLSKIEKDEIKRALKSAQRTAVFVGDSAEAYTTYVLSRLVHNLEYDLDKISEQLQTASESDWQDAIKRLMTPNNLSFSATGDVEGLLDLWELHKEALIIE